MLPLALILGAIGVLFYYYAIKPMSYWKDRGVIQGNPRWFFGDTLRQFLKLENSATAFQKAYDLAPNARYCGIYQFTTPSLMVKDPKLVKQITVKDFGHFVNHRELISEKADPMWGKNLLNRKDQEWRDLRSLLSPAFTSSKMKMIYNLMGDCSENFINHFLKKGEDVTEVTMKDIFARFANDVIASTAFGVETDSLEKQNEFYSMGQELVELNSFSKTLKFFGFMLFPKIFEYLKIHLFDGISRKFFIDLIYNTIKTREQQKIVRPDMLHLLMEAKNASQKNEDGDTGLGKSSSIMKIDNMDIAANVIIFFFAGFESVSSLLCFMSYELALQPEIQTKLRKEIDEGFHQCYGKLTYDKLMKMKYLDMVVSETARKWPNFPVTDRMCNKTYVIEPENPQERRLVVEKGTLIELPLMAMHYDSKFFPDPQRFDPERFNEENQDKIDPYAYFPFGLGPRNCIGSRFATLEAKTLFAHLLHNFEIVITSKTQIPVKLSNSFSINPEDGIQLGLKRLKE